MTWLRTSGLRLFFAFVLSFALWLYVSYSENPEQSTSFEGMPVYVQNLPDGLVIVDQDGIPRTDQSVLSQVSVVVKTDQETLRGLRQKHLRAFVDLSNLPPGENQVKVSIEPTTSDVRLSNFSLISPEPEYLSVRLDEWVSKTISLTIEVKGNLPFSFERGEAMATVDGEEIQEVQVEGPQEQVSRVTRASAVANIEQLRASYASLLQLVALDANNDVVRGVEINPPVVNVRVPIRSVVGLKRVPVLGVLEGTPAEGFVVQSVQCDPPLINITGSSGRLDYIDNVETLPVPIDGATATLTRQVSLDFPRGVSSSSNEDSQVVVKVDIVPLVRPFQVELPFAVKVTGAGEQLQVEYNPRFLSVLLQGTASVLAQINSSHLVAIVDVSGLGPGLYDLSPQFVLPDGLRVVGEIPAINVALRLVPTPSSISPAPSPQSGGSITPTISVSPVVPRPGATQPATTTRLVPVLTPTSAPLPAPAEPDIPTPTPDIPADVDEMDETENLPEESPEEPEESERLPTPPLAVSSAPAMPPMITPTIPAETDPVTPSLKIP